VEVTLFYMDTVGGTDFMRLITAFRSCFIGCLIMMMIIVIVIIIINFIKSRSSTFFYLSGKK